MKYDAIIFDLDGTLWNANKSCTDAWNSFLGKKNYSKRITVAEMDAVTGTPVDKAIDLLLPGIRTEHKDIKNILTGFEKIFVGKNGGDLYPGVLSGINNLSQLCKIFIVSNCEEWYLKKFIEFSGLGGVLTGSDCYGSSGVDKYLMINNIKNRHNLSLVVYVGDTTHDQTASKLSHCDFIQMTYGFGKPISDVVQCRTFIELYNYLLSK